MEKGKLRSLTSAEIAAEAEMDSGQKAVPDIAFEILAAGKNYCRIFCKETDNRMCNPLHQDGGNKSKACCDKDCIAQCLQSTVFSSGTNILCTKCRNGGKHGGRNQEKKADNFFHNANCGSVSQAAAVCNNCDDKKRNLNKSIL